MESNKENSKLENRNISKCLKTKIFKTVSDFEIFDIVAVCFGFRNSYFGFIQLASLRIYL